MQQSPDDHDIEVLDGDAGSIVERGRAIVQLGAKMVLASGTMQQLLEDGAEQEGAWVDKLKESSKEVYQELDKAGSLYQDVGPFVRDYGTALETAQSSMRTIVPECERLWKIFESKVTAVADAESAPVDYPDDGADEEGRKLAEEQHGDAVTTARDERDAAYAAWKREADDFDDVYSTWWQEFEDACKGIEQSNDEGIEDSWKDNLDGLVEFLQTVLSIAGLVLAVLALIIGGPIVGLLALIVGVIALGLTIYQFCRGDASGWDLAFAIVGVLPIGAIGDFASGGVKTGLKSWVGLSGGMSFGDDAARWSLSLTGSGVSPATWVSNMRGLAPEAGYLAGEGGQMFAQFISKHGEDTWTALGDIGHAPWAIAYTADAVGNYFGVIPGMVRDPIQLGTSAGGTYEQLRWPTY